MSDENVQYLIAKVKQLIAKQDTKLALSVWIRESGLGPPTHIWANSKPAASRAPLKALTSQARIGQVRLVTLHTRTSLTHWNPEPSRTRKPDSYVYGHLNTAQRSTITVPAPSNIVREGIIRNMSHINTATQVITSSISSRWRKPRSQHKAVSRSACGYLWKPGG